MINKIQEQYVGSDDNTLKFDINIVFFFVLFSVEDIILVAFRGLPFVLRRWIGSHDFRCWSLFDKFFLIVSAHENHASC